MAIFTYVVKGVSFFRSILNGLERTLFMQVLRLDGLGQTRFGSIFGTFGDGLERTLLPDFW